MSTSVEIPTAAPTSAAELAPAPGPNGGQGTVPSTALGLDLWLENFRKYELTLQEVTKASADTKFKDELNAIEKWFKVLSEAERTASVYSLLLHSNQEQIRFFITVLQQMIRPDVPKPAEPPVEAPAKKSVRIVRPPSLDLSPLGSPTTPTPITTKDHVSLLPTDGENTEIPPDLVRSTLKLETSLSVGGDDHKNPDSATAEGLPGMGLMSPYHLNVLANAGLSKEAQVLAVQLLASGIFQPVTDPSQAKRQAAGKKPPHLGDAKNWRTPTSAKYPASALRSSGLRATVLKGASLKSATPQSAGLQSAGLKSAGIDSASLGTPREEDFQPEMLDDIPTWLRSLRLHKYTACFDGLTWQEMVVLDDATLESKGIAALGARRRLLRTFEHVRKRMGMESPDATPTTSSLFPSSPFAESGEALPKVPHSAAPTSKLSITSPVFVPSFERGPQSAAPVLSATESAPSPSTE